MENNETIAFISHATADNDRFVVPFNSALVRPRISTIVDVQDFRPGESLVERIFDRGIYQSNAVIIVISRNTQGRNWVRAELEHAVVRNIEENTPVITIVLDGAEVPPPLRTALQVRVEAGKSPNDVAEEVATALLARRDQTAPVTEKPKARWALATLRGIEDATPLDEYVGRYAVEQVLTTNYEYVDVAALLQDIRDSGQGGEEDLDATLHALDHDGLIERQNEIGARLPFAFSLTQRGAAILLVRYVPVLFRETTQEVITRLKQAYPGGFEISDLATQLAAPPWLVLQIGMQLEARGAARVEQYLGGWGDVSGTPTIRRL